MLRAKIAPIAWPQPPPRRAHERAPRAPKSLSPLSLSPARLPLGKQLARLPRRVLHVQPRRRRQRQLGPPLGPPLDLRLDLRLNLLVRVRFRARIRVRVRAKVRVGLRPASSHG